MFIAKTITQSLATADSRHHGDLDLDRKAHYELEQLRWQHGSAQTPSEAQTHPRSERSRRQSTTDFLTLLEKLDFFACEKPF